MSQEARYNRNLDRNKLQCTLCPHNCEILSGYPGSCKVRYSKENTLYLKTANQIKSSNLVLIEQLRVFHYLPGLQVFTIEFVGDNFKGSIQDNLESLTPKTAKQIVQEVISHRANAIAFVGREPTTNLEFLIQIAAEAKESGLHTILITNGYVNKNPLEDLLPFLDVVHQKFFYFSEENMQQECRALLEPLQKSAKIFKTKKDIHFEVSIELFQENEKLSLEVEDFLLWSKENLKLKTPIHLILRSGESDSLITEAKKISDTEELPFVYTSDTQNTNCPKCKKTIISRVNFTLLDDSSNQGKCSCGKVIPGVFVEKE